MKDSENSFLLSFGKAIRRLREQAGISQEKLADLAQLDRTYVGGIERGERNISLKNLKKISDALGVKISKVFEAINE